MSILFEEKNFCGDTVRVTYDKDRLGLQYRAEVKGKWLSRVAFGTLCEAMSYAMKLVKGGK